MKQISYTSSETYFLAGTDIEDARERMSPQLSPRDAWNALDYWDREENYDDFEVFEFQVTEKVTKVNPPYAR
ncbi:hypothetical protein AB0D68_10965 [Streptomyces sp. NPDC048212]|uniref:hypothetical protein n=1 Tax=Streptomyces sp. NPDC048212 TaxID=3156658 RepID=UPI00340624F4